MNFTWQQKLFVKKILGTLFAGLWIIVFILPIYNMIRTFPIYGSFGDIIYAIGKDAGMVGIFFLSFVISSLCIFNQIKKIVDPVRLYKVICIIEHIAITLILFHPLLLVYGRSLAGFQNPYEIILPDISNFVYLFLFYGFVAFWMVFISGIVFVNRNSIKLSKYWEYIHTLIYPAFFLALVHGFMTGSDSMILSQNLLFIYYAVVLGVIYKVAEIVLVHIKRGKKK